MRQVLVALVLWACAGQTIAAPCESEDFETNVTGDAQCLRMRVYGDTGHPAAMVVWIHGDLSRGGLADYHFAMAQQIAREVGNIVSVALVRPGYLDGTFKSSTVNSADSGRVDNYTRNNIGEIGSAIARLKAHFGVSKAFLVGHSGGAAISAVLLGIRPSLVEGAVLVGCPCDVATWRSKKLLGLYPFKRSEDPLKWVGQVPQDARVVAITGADDDNTFPELARSYVDALVQRGVNAEFQLLPHKGHDDSFRAPDVGAAVKNMCCSANN